MKVSSNGLISASYSTLYFLYISSYIYFARRKRHEYDYL